MILRSLFTTFFLSFCLVLGAGFFFLENHWVDCSLLEQEAKACPSVVLDDQGNELARFELDRRELISYPQIPDVVVKAFVAAEDHQFFNHTGFSIKGIIRSALVNLYNGRVVQGASTITQQVARLLYLSHERTWWRKIKELFVALQLERQLSKEQILELYLNNMYFGRGIYGVQAACKRFWNKSVDQVVLHEAAMLAAVAKSARFYSPLNAPLTARRRRNVVLRSMCTLGFIGKHEFEEARETPLEIEDYIPGNPIRLYIQEWVRAWAENKWGKEALYSKGLRIKTTINVAMQQAAEDAFAPKIKKMREEMGEILNGGMVCVHAPTGAIKAFVGGYDFKKSQFNRAFQAYRQTGSSFKPILYSLAMTSGFEMDNVFIDEPIELVSDQGKIWKPRNWNRKFEGSMTLVRALAFSNNIIAVKLLMQIGAPKVAAWARHFGIVRDLTPYPSLALGTAHASVEENVAAFNVFANNGVYVKPHLVEWVKDEWGRKGWDYEPVEQRVLDTKTNSKMVKALTCRLIFSKQFYEKKGWLQSEAIGKSGSTNEAMTTWFVGSTPEYTTAIYVGRDDNKPMGKYVYASSTAFPIWLNFAKQLPCTKKNFYYDPELNPVTINWLTGRQTSEHDPAMVTILQ
ncbi:PBP1A family penicillin-binding protein [Candidatus Babeliales bacterium]|nr:PBP1A family penicillin-binding protein [Candidatus Babeliales bacterium]